MGTECTGVVFVHGKAVDDYFWKYRVCTAQLFGFMLWDGAVSERLCSKKIVSYLSDRQFLSPSLTVSQAINIFETFYGNVTSNRYQENFLYPKGAIEKEAR